MMYYFVYAIYVCRIQLVCMVGIFPVPSIGFLPPPPPLIFVPLSLSGSITVLEFGFVNTKPTTGKYIELCKGQVNT